MKKLLIILIFPLLFVGCETIRSIVDSTTEVIEANPLIAKTAIQYGVLKFVDGDAEKQEAVINFLSTSREFIDSTSVVRVDSIANTLKDQIKWEDLSTANARLINTLFDTVQRYVTREVDGENLSSESIVVVHRIFDWIEEAVSLSKLGVYVGEDS